MVPHLPCYTWLDLVPSRFRYLNRKLFFSTLMGLFSVTVVRWSSLQKEHHVWDSLQTDSVSHAAVPNIMGNASEGNMSKMLSCVRSSDSFFWEMGTWSLKRVYLHLGTETCLGKLLEKQSLGMLLLNCLTIISNEWETRVNMGSDKHPYSWSGLSL